jgi:hypothetical protein
MRLLLSLVLIALVLFVTLYPEWASKKTVINGVEGTTKMGLWRMCGTYNETSSCVSIPQGGNPNFPKSALYAVRAFMILACICMVFAITRLRHQSSFYGLAGLFTLISIVVYGSKLLNYQDGTGKAFKPQFVFYLAILACVTSWGAGLYANQKLY